jgi:hypothetical protein
MKKEQRNKTQISAIIKANKRGAELKLDSS